MELKISFFARNLIDAIGAGIYQVSIQYQDREEPLYIGESIFVLVRCAAHLFELKKDPGYFGFTAQSIQNPDITLNFTLLQTCDDPIKRKKLEKEYIKAVTPELQSGISDRMKPVEEKICALTEFLQG